MTGAPGAVTRAWRSTRKCGRSRGRGPVAPVGRKATDMVAHPVRCSERVFRPLTDHLGNKNKIGWAKGQNKVSGRRGAAVQDRQCERLKLACRKDRRRLVCLKKKVRKCQSRRHFHHSRKRPWQTILQLSGDPISKDPAATTSTIATSNTYNRGLEGRWRGGWDGRR